MESFVIEDHRLVIQQAQTQEADHLIPPLSKRHLFAVALFEFSHGIIDNGRESRLGT